MAIVDEATVVHLLLKGILDPALEVAKLQKKVRARGGCRGRASAVAGQARDAWVPGRP